MKRYFQILKNHRHPVRFVLARILVKTGLCRLFKIRQNGYLLAFSPSNLAEQLWIEPSGRVEALEFFYRYIKAGDCVLDIGANVGDTVLVSALQAGPGGKVFAIEAHPVTFEHLRGNLRLNGVSNVELFNTAVGEQAGSVSFGNDRRDDMNRVGDPGITVPMIRVDDLIPAQARPDLLKIDVEGYELPVLMGAADTLARTECIYFEISDQLSVRFGYRARDLAEFIQRQGFTIFRQLDGGALERVSRIDEVEGVTNFVAARNPDRLVERTGWQLVA